MTNAKTPRKRRAADGWFQIEVTGEHAVGDGRRQVIDEAALTAIVNGLQGPRNSISAVILDPDSPVFHANSPFKNIISLRKFII